MSLIGAIASHNHIHETSFKRTVWVIIQAHRDIVYKYIKHVCIYVYVYIYMYICIHICIYIYVYVYVYIYICIYIDTTYISLHIYTCYMCIYIITYVYIYICVCEYTCRCRYDDSQIDV